MEKKLFNKNSLLNLPNLLTIIRMIMVVPFITLMSIVIKDIRSNGTLIISFKDFNLTTTLFLISAIIFIIAMFTDFLDGYIARKYNLVSNFGKLFDPLADKWITTSAFILLSIQGFTPYLTVIGFILRDLLVDASKNIAAKNSIKVGASILGKLKTVLQSIGIIVIFIVVPIIEIEEFSLNYWLIQIPIFIALLMSIISGIQYFARISKYL